MSDLTTFETVAEIVAILSFLLTVIGFTRNTYRAYKKKRQRAEQEFKKALARLRAARKTISARSDVGFLMLIELGALRDTISNFRHGRILAFVGAAFLVICTIFIRGSVIADRTLLPIFLVLFYLSLACMIMSIVFHFILRRLERYTDSYEDRIKEVWERPVKRKSGKSVGPTTGST